MNIISFFILFFLLVGSLWPEPIVLTGKMVPMFLGRNIDAIRVTSHTGVCIPFQIDEVENADFICPMGKEPNKGNGVLDTADEIVFLWEDADTVGPKQSKEMPEVVPVGDTKCVVTIFHGSETRIVYLSNNPALPLSPVSYINYSDAKELVRTPYYYACFGRDRFHFISAGLKNRFSDQFLDLTNELRIRIVLKALWGLLPITYTENNIVCFVKRYKTGPVRLIRRGDFHLNLGMFLQGSHAAVNQICYPQLVRVPVYVHLPVKFRTLFKEAYIEMTPVFRKDASGFFFTVPERKISFGLGEEQRTDTLVRINPNHSCMTVHNNDFGYGWVLDAAMDQNMLDGSGYRFKVPSETPGICRCGFRLTVRDLPKGYYLIGNWILFSNEGPRPLQDACDHLSVMARVAVPGNPALMYNQLDKIQAFKKR
jgi:hypothetical protein